MKITEESGNTWRKSAVATEPPNIATQGYTEAKRVLLGSPAARVVRHAHWPVLAVREQSRETPR